MRNEAVIKEAVSLGEKYTLTIEEAAKYFGIGQKKLRRIAEDHSGSGFVLHNGVKLLIKRKQFERFIDDTSEI